MGLTDGPAVEIDGGKSQLFSNLEVRDAIGSGNAVFRCGSDSDSNADAGDNMYQSIRAETDQNLFSGAQFPSYDFDAAAQCHDSRFYADTAVNATIANFNHVNGGGLHIDHLHTFNSISTDASGSALYGIVSAQHDYIVGAQIDDATMASLFLAPNGKQAANGQRAIETWIDCGNLKGIGVPAAVTFNMLGSVSYSTAPSTISVVGTAGITAGMVVSGISIPLGDTVASTDATHIYLTNPALGNITNGHITVTRVTAA
jgi:hypothetical protein